MKNYMPLILLILLLSASLACSILKPSESLNPGSVETQVASTFTALAPEESATAVAPTPVLETPSEVLGPTPEPAGMRVVYVKDDIIYLWQEDKSPRAVTGSGSPIYSLDLSDDGQMIAFTRHVGEVQAELWAVNSDGANERLLVSEQDFKAYDPDALAVVPFHFSWVPGSQILAYNTNQVFDGPGLGLYDDLRLVDAETMT